MSEAETGRIRRRISCRGPRSFPLCGRAVRRCARLRVFFPRSGRARPRDFLIPCPTCQPLFSRRREISVSLRRSTASFRRTFRLVRSGSPCRQSLFRRRTLRRLSRREPASTGSSHSERPISVCRAPPLSRPRRPCGTPARICTPASCRHTPPDRRSRLSVLVLQQPYFLCLSI